MRRSLTPGTNFSFSTPKPILTRSGELVAHLAGRPKDPSFVCSLQSLEGLMDAACPSVIPERWAKRVDDSRGSHTAVSMGLSLGGGSTVSPLCLGGLVMCLPSSSVQANSRYPQSELLKQ